MKGSPITAQRRPLASNERLCFIHLEKTGGTTVHHLLRANYGPVLLFPVGLERYLWPNHYRNPHTFNLWLRGCENAERRARANSAIARFRAVGGHSFFGIHADFYYTFRYITVLRDPERRVVSQFHHDTHPPLWTRLRHSAYFRQWHGLSLEAWAGRRLERGHGVNLMVRRMAGRDSPPEERLTRAQSNLQRIEFVLFTETLAEGLAELANALDWRNHHVRTQRVGRYERRALTAQEQAAVAPLIDQDVKLFRSVKGSR